MEVPYEYQLALADYWEGRPTTEPNVWVPGLPLQMTVAAPASNSDLVVSSTGQQQLVQESTHHQHAVEVELVFNEVTQSLKQTVDNMAMKMHLFPPNMEDLASYKAPKVVSIGPYHHGESEALKQMESIKHAAAVHFIDNTGCSIQEVYGAVCAVAEVARGHYEEDKMRTASDDDFKHMLFFDGCFLLQYMLFWCRRVNEDDDDETTVDVDPSLHSVFSSNDSRIFCDVVLLENQLPWVVVDTLKRFMRTPPTMELFVRRVKIDKMHTRQELEFVLAPLPNYTPPHLLGLLRYHIVGNTKVPEPSPLSDKVKEVSWSVGVIELAEIGIEVTPNDIKEDLKKMYIDRGCFTGELRLASVSLGNATATFLVNMAVFEMCTTPDFDQDDDEMSTVCSYLWLLGMVTDSVSDVQELRNKHILEGGAGLTNEDVLKLFTGVEKHLRIGRRYYKTIVDIANYRYARRPWIMFYRFGYRNRTTIITVITTIVGAAGFLATLKSFR
ncbi:hypothetical protein CFC21_018634 [Triticum aestivum]|uniref:Uncharacterized protein n=4 Tax=Triticum TaxID=4564 RepID=A0A9R1J497_WHEAT|nr:UPF0481 protein At3g47200-like [Triticum dicoccoides]XP_044460361.1 UPF0481 protein At3g47200-like [Triticum aestivum]XP_048553206.1 UPF0481 protein At3g47200-like [Triticum urartu]VAH35783.1 unnamed protein product [Triticum turgidum subsp. durum]EMS52232.1 hypothetical protein TRIUR3_01819 [Triticum urartu]KAF6999698.1 hypothetical protein CFC21_015677 [Triticum aestivum]KAF7003292.1 hypothetical protein CFC21_018634 [Triticum aestivum]